MHADKNMSVYHISDYAKIHTYSGIARDFDDIIGTQNGTSIVEADTGWPISQHNTLHYDGQRLFWAKPKGDLWPHHYRVRYTTDSTSTAVIKTVNFEMGSLAPSYSQLHQVQAGIASDTVPDAEKHFATHARRVAEKAALLAHQDK